MRKTGLSLLLLATVTSCVGGRTRLLDDSHRGKTDAALVLRDAGLDRQADRIVLDTRPEALDLALDRAPDGARPDTSPPDTSPDRAFDRPAPDTRPLPDLGPDRALDLRTPDRSPDRGMDLDTPDAMPFGADLVPDRPQDLPGLETPPLGPDLPPDRPLDGPLPDAPGPDLPWLEGLNLDLASDSPLDIPAGAVDAGPDAGLDAGDAGTMAGCVPGTPYVLVLGNDQRLYRFDPQAVSLTDIVDVSCGSDSLNSLTVSPLGPAYISSVTGQLCRLDVKTFQTTITPFDPAVIQSYSYGMSLLPDSSPAGQTLYISVNANGFAALKTINLTSFTLGDIGTIDPATRQVELTAGPNGQLFGLSTGSTTSLLRIDPLTASSLETVALPEAGLGGIALVHWEGSVYLFMVDASDSSIHNVYRYSTSDGQVRFAGNVPVSIIGAGVALCQ